MSFFYGFINSPALVSLKGIHKDLAKISLLPNKDITIFEDLGWVAVFFFLAKSISLNISSLVRLKLKFS